MKNMVVIKMKQNQLYKMLKMKMDFNQQNQKKKINDVMIKNMLMMEYHFMIRIMMKNGVKNKNIQMITFILFSVIIIIIINNQDLIYKFNDLMNKNMQMIIYIILTINVHDSVKKKMMKEINFYYVNNHLMKMMKIKIMEINIQMEKY